MSRPFYVRLGAHARKSRGDRRRCGADLSQRPARRDSRALDQLERAAELHLVEAALSVNRVRELERQIDEGRDLPPITVEGIRTMVEGIAGNLGAYFAEAVNEIFEWLRPSAHTRNGQLKTNSQNEVPPKVIVSCVRVWCGRFEPCDYSRPRIVGVDNVFHFLDGKQPPATYNGRLGEAIIASTNGEGETEYFRFRCFGNGNLHLWFKRLDLLRKLNEAAGGRRLRREQEAA